MILKERVIPAFFAGADTSTEKSCPFGAFMSVQSGKDFFVLYNNLSLAKTNQFRNGGTYFEEFRKKFEKT